MVVLCYATTRARLCLLCVRVERYSLELFRTTTRNGLKNKKQQTTQENDLSELYTHGFRKRSVVRELFPHVKMRTRGVRRQGRLVAVLFVEMEGIRVRDTFSPRVLVTPVLVGIRTVFVLGNDGEKFVAEVR